MSDSLVSVVTPVHNTAAYLAECIESVLRQTHQRWEYLVIDNASTDGSGDIARGYAERDARVRVLRFDELVPQVPNYNRALGLISPASRYVKVLEADNWMFPECLQRMVALADARPDVGLVSAYNTTETRLRLTGLPLAREVVDGHELGRMHLSGQAYLFGAPSTVLMRADLVRARTPFYDEDCHVAEDLDACYHMLRSCSFGFVHQVLTFVRTENDSILSKIKGYDAQALDRVAMLERHGSAFLPAAELAAVRARTLDRYYEGLALGALGRGSAAYWDFHRRGLASVGLSIDRGRLAGALLRELTGRAVHPLRTWRARRGQS
jgi:glycosyltransferase involved in cell wall biosynthesis